MTHTQAKAYIAKHDTIITITKHFSEGVIRYPNVGAVLIIFVMLILVKKAIRIQRENVLMYKNKCRECGDDLYGHEAIDGICDLCKNG